MSDSALEVIQRPEFVALGTLNASTPAALVAGASEMAKALAAVIDTQKLYSTIQGRKFVRVEGWTTLATMMGVMPRERSVLRLEDGGYEATVDLVRVSDGVVLTSASAECGSDERTWADRPRYARRSMAITRATSKACRIAFSWVMALAGYEVTPAEEMDGVHELEPAKPAARRTERDVTPPKAGKITDKQMKLVWFRAAEKAKEFGEGVTREDVVRDVLRAVGVEHTQGIPAASFDHALKLLTEWEPGKSDATAAADAAY